MIKNPDFKKKIYEKHQDYSVSRFTANNESFTGILDNDTRE